MKPLEQYKTQHKIKTYVELNRFEMMTCLGGILNVGHLSDPDLYPALIY